MVGWKRVACAVVLLSLVAGAQTNHKPAEKPPIPMPADRTVDSYQIYSKLAPPGEIGDWPYGMVLVEGMTTAIRADYPCNPTGLMDNDLQNPHSAVTPSKGYYQDFDEILDDFDLYCHDRILLTGGEQWKTSVPVRVLNAAEQEEFVRLLDFFKSRTMPDSERAVLEKRYAGATGLSSFSEIYFNKRHTVALVYAAGWCGNMCAEGGWVGLALQDGEWKRLPWRTSWTIS